jgi:hypothetical protein
MPLSGLAICWIDPAGGLSFPAPKRYQATTLFAPEISRDPRMPSPKVTMESPSSFCRTM